MEFVKALLVFFVLSGCAEVASELPQGGAVHAGQQPAALRSASFNLQGIGDAARLGPPSPRGVGARRVDPAAASATIARN